MTNVLVNTEVKISAENIIDKYVDISLDPGTNYKIPGLNKYSGIIVYYQVNGNGYKNNFFIPREHFVSTWYADSFSTNQIFVRIHNESIDVSANSVGPVTKVVGFKVIY